MNASTDYEIARAQRHARATATADRPVTECPYDVNGTDVQRVLAMRWVRAYLELRPPANGDVDHTFDDVPAEDPDGAVAGSALGDDRIAPLATHRQATSDLHPGGEQLHHYWTKDPEGLAKWVDKPHPWTSLYHHLLKFMPESPQKAKATAAKWFRDVFGIWPGERAGSNPTGPG